MGTFRGNLQGSINFGELVVDNFAGGGGASTGIEQAIGRPVDIAINHDPVALAMHETNHPHTKHYCESVWDINPREVTQGRPVGLAWFSPDCTHHSKARGGKPVSPRVRGLAWVVMRWVGTVRPRIIMLENVEEFVSWGPVVRREDGQQYPCPKRRGHTFRSFVNALRRHGYQVEWRELRACPYGAPTIRKRLFLIARCDGAPIIWPEPTHGPDLKPYRSAADIIDWSLPCPSIFLSKEEGRAVGVRRPLAEATQRRIAEGIRRFVLQHPDPFIVKVNHGYDYFRGQPINQPLQTITAGANGYGVVVPTLAASGAVVGCGGRAGQSRPRGLDEPVATITAKGDTCLAVPYLVPRYGEAPRQRPRCADAADPLPTIVPTGNHGQLVQAFLAKHYTGVTGSDLRRPIGTVTAVDHHSLVTSHMIKLRGDNVGSHPDDPLHTISAGGFHHGQVQAFLMKYYGQGGQWQDVRDPVHTLPTKARMGLVMVKGQPYQLVDIGMRMLQPHELYQAQGFPPDYIIDRTWDGRRLTKAEQNRMCGNSVSPYPVEAMVTANYQPNVAAAAA